MEKIKIFFFLAGCTDFDVVGNGKCNKKANVAECNFDGGDCCSQCKKITVSVNVPEQLALG